MRVSKDMAVTSSVADPGSGDFLMEKIWIRDENPRSFFRETVFLGAKILKFFEIFSTLDQ